MHGAFKVLVHRLGLHGDWANRLSPFLVATRLPLSLRVCECVTLAGKQKHVAFQGASGLQGDLVSEDSAY